MYMLSGFLQLLYCIVSFLYKVPFLLNTTLSLPEMMKSLVFNELSLLRRNTVIQIVVRRSWLNNEWQAIIFHQSVSKISRLARTTR